ncbi:MAG: hypothetical protein IT584_00865 [Chlamydiae bacterium]|nr:hypothetical protein [Chlamydiota bacterium]
MALYALYFEDLISANDAPDQGNFYCLECRGPLRIRERRQRRHFYHIKTSPNCRLYSKSEEHLVLQSYIQALFPLSEILLERPFLSIRRIADACWEKGKTVFEVQCSPISEQEVQNRVRDYESLGYSLVWLLSDQRFNQPTLQAAEKFLREGICYFDRYQKTKKPFFYDQFEILKNNKRLKKSAPLPIDLTRPQKNPKLPENIPQQISNRAQKRLFFEGDLVYNALASRSNTSLIPALQNWAFFEREAQKEQNKFLNQKHWLKIFWCFSDWLFKKTFSNFP